MTYNLDHLTKSAQAIVNLTTRERINFVYEGAWINHAVVSDFRNTILSIASLPQIAQAQCLLVSAAGGMGKSTLCRRIEQDLEIWAKRRQCANPSLAISLSQEATTASILDDICNAIGFSGAVNKKHNISPSISRMFKLRGVRFLLIDEIHHLLLANRNDQRRSLALLKNISGLPLSVSIIGFGVEDAVNAITGDLQLSRRFQIFELQHWKASEDLRSFLASYERCLPLKAPSHLHSKEIVTFLINNTLHTTRDIVKRISWGAIYALINGDEFITVEHLREASNFPNLTELDDD